MACRLIFPPLPVVALCLVLIVMLMVWVFAGGNQSSLWAIPAYVVSAYGTVVVCAALTRAPSPQKLREAARTLPAFGATIGKLLDDRIFRSFTMARLGLAIDIPWALVNLAVGAWGQSVWLITLGVYYACLALMRGLLSRHEHMAGAGDNGGNPARALRLCFRCAIVTMLLALSLAGVVVLNLRNMGTFHHPEWMTIAVATYAFAKLGAATWKLVTYRDTAEPIMFALSSVSLASGLATLLTMEILMLDVFADASTDAGFRLYATAGTGAVVVLGVLATGLALVLRVGRPCDVGGRESC